METQDSKNKLSSSIIVKYLLYRSSTFLFPMMSWILKSFSDATASAANEICLNHFQETLEDHWYC